MSDKIFEIKIEAHRNKETTHISIDFPKKLPIDLHIEDIRMAIASELARRGKNLTTSVLTKEDIHKRVNEEFGKDRIPLWGDHSHGVNSRGAHSHN